MATHEIELKTSIASINVGSPGVSGELIANNLEVYNGKMGVIIPNDFPVEIPGGVINVGDTLVVRLVNDLPVPVVTGIHWHGIELQNNADGTQVTQNPIPAGNIQMLGGVGPFVGGTHLYKFKVTRPGIFWFHPHHFHSTNRVFKGLYGMLVVTDPNESALIPGTIPDASNTEQVILSDITVCGAPGGSPTNNPGYDLSLPWAGPGGVLPPQAGFSPEQLCEIRPVDEEGSSIGVVPFNAGEVPNLQRPTGKINEGITVLTNGANVGPRGGTPDSPDPIDPSIVTMIDVQPGQGLRLQLANCSIGRYFRLRLTTNDGTQINLVRIGGEGGILDHAVLEGGIIDGFDTKYSPGEILLAPGERADVVAAIPDDGTTDLTMWTLDFERFPGAPVSPVVQGPYSFIPTVPVLHLNVTGASVAPAFTITGTPNGIGGTPLRASTGDLVDELTITTPDTFLDPAGFSPPKEGRDEAVIWLSPGSGINSLSGEFSGDPYTSIPHISSSRYVKEGDMLELTVSNGTGAHHPFHLHGFSFQPKSITGPSGTFTYDYNEFRDTLDVPSEHSLIFRVKIEDDRPFADDSTTHRGGSLGRWLFHCHIFFHAHRGMISELVVTDKDGSGDEKPYISVYGSWAYAPSGMIAERRGWYFLRDGDTLGSIVAHLQDGTPIGDISIDTTTKKWFWQSHTPPDPALPDQINYVYVTITGTSGRKDQAVFRLQIGGVDEGSDIGDPHIKTLDGTKYDFQAVGEFILLADRDGMMIQSRQTPVATAKPITHPYSGLTSCVSVNTAVAARVGSHYISYQPNEKEEGVLDFYVDGKLTELTLQEFKLDNNTIKGISINGKMTLRVDFSNHAVLIVTPRFWNSKKIHYLNISVYHTHGDEGIMGKIPEGHWLPKLKSGARLGRKPRDLQERYIQLYQTFADSWRVKEKNSLFTYEKGKSTSDYTDKDWPAFQPPCELKKKFEIPGSSILPEIPEDDAKVICEKVTEVDLFANCVLDVSTTGDETFADGYLTEQRIRQKATSIMVVEGKEKDKFVVTAIVKPLSKSGERPDGNVVFTLNGSDLVDPVSVDAEGKASLQIDDYNKGDKIGARYEGGDDLGLSSSSSSEIIISREPERKEDEGKIKYWWYLLLIILLIIIVMFFIFI
ncbi:multicopper oxidase domain-containing protein [Mangrovivirga sp. M17]|uniref:Multicopper oxidase domain-containing protein n=1 Tax=Mangrovivirga halotolerans TaxID=2993936 RepID=A0ABT3RQS9_9BACT|nr:multicopper oxidase domain-containing protein [Mangrovivirga halotolerans]MCX2743713.1 multicopper oxidase domain-containing protein [Mangrovivirga halotolerans]